MIAGKAWLPFPEADFCNKLIPHFCAGRYEIKLTANSCIALCSSSKRSQYFIGTHDDTFRYHARLRSRLCALHDPALRRSPNHPGLLKLSAIISQ